MSKEMVDAIMNGNNVEAGNAFEKAMSDKVGDALEVKRMELSKTFVKGEGEEVEAD